MKIPKDLEYQVSVLSTVSAHPSVKKKLHICFVDGQKFQRQIHKQIVPKGHRLSFRNPMELIRSDLSFSLKVSSIENLENQRLMKRLLDDIFDDEKLIEMVTGEKLRIYRVQGRGVYWFNSPNPVRKTLHCLQLQIRGESFEKEKEKENSIEEVLNLKIRGFDFSKLKRERVPHSENWLEFDFIISLIQAHSLQNWMKREIDDGILFPEQEDVRAIDRIWRGMRWNLLEEQEMMILNSISQRELTAKEISESTGIKLHGVYLRLKKLAQNGLICKRTGHPSLWYLIEK